MLNILKKSLVWLSIRGILLLVPFIATSFVFKQQVNYNYLYDSLVSVIDSFIPTLMEQFNFSNYYVGNREVIQQKYSDCIPLGFKTPATEEKSYLSCLSCEDLANYSDGYACADKADGYMRGIKTTDEFLNFYANFCKSGESFDLGLPCLSCNSLLSYSQPSQCLNATIYSTINENEQFEIMGSLEGIISSAIRYSLITLAALLAIAYGLSADRVAVTKGIAKSIMIGGLLSVLPIYLLIASVPLLLEQALSAQNILDASAMSYLKPVADKLISAPLYNVLYVQIGLFAVGLVLFIYLKFYTKKKHKKN